MPERPDLTIVAPMYNEAENVADTIAKIKAAMADFAGSWEFVLVNDGSTDDSFETARRLSADEPDIRVVGYEVNRGRGAALRTGFDAAEGKVVAAVDFDLSYTPDHILGMYEILASSPEVDMVMASCYMPGGAVEGVSPKRLWISRIGNLILRLAFDRRFHTTTCVVRAYRREVLEALVLESEDKEIHLEILSKALALGFNVVEMPATLRSRKKGKAKFRFVRTSLTHLAFAFRERPWLLAEAVMLSFTLVASPVLAWFIATLKMSEWNNRGYSGPPLETVIVAFAVASGLVYSCAIVLWLVLQRRKDKRDAATRRESTDKLLRLREVTLHHRDLRGTERRQQTFGTTDEHG